MTNIEIRGILVERLSQNLPEIRKIAGWSGEDLGGMLGMSRQSISKLETGLSAISVAQYIAIRHLLDAWIINHPENKTLPRVVTLLLDDRRIWGAEYTKLRSVAKTISAVVSGGANQDAVDAISKVLLDEWEGPAREYCYTKLKEPMIASKVGVTADTEPGDWTEIILSGRKNRYGKQSE